MSQFAWTFPGGKHKQEVTSVVLVNNVTKTIDVTVPAGKIWILQSIKVTNIDDVTRDVSINLYKEVAKTNLVSQLVNLAALAANGAAVLQYPSNFVHTSDHYQDGNRNRILSAANTISIVWLTGGASTGATDADGLVVDYLEIDAP